MDLTKEELMEISHLIDVAESILKVYTNLFVLEIKGRYDTEEYKKEIFNLKSGINLFNSIFGNLSNDYEKNELIIKYLNSIMDNETDENQSCFTITMQVGLTLKDLVLHRIRNNFAFKNMNNRDSLVQKLASGYNILPEDFLELDSDGSVLKAYQMNLLSVPYFSLDICNLVITLLGYHNCTDYYMAVWIKYYLSCLMPSIEKDLVDRNFAILEHPFLVADCLKGICGIGEEELIACRNDMCGSLFMSISKFILEYKEIDLNNQDIIDGININLAYLRAFLIMMSSEHVASMRKQLENYIKDGDCMQDNPKLIKAVLDVFNYLEEDRKIPQIVSFGL